MVKSTSSFYRFFKRCKIGDMLQSHYATFYDNATEKKYCSRWEIFWQFFIFTCLSALMTYFGLYFSKTALDSVLTVQSILTAFLFSALFIVADKRDKAEKGSKDYRLKDDTTNNISFCILLSMILLVVTTVYSVILPNYDNSISILLLWTYRLLNVFMYFLILNQIYVFLMIMKRVNKIFS